MSASDESVWITHPDIEAKGQIAAGALYGWQRRGWVVCDPPDELDRYRDPDVAAPVPDVVPDVTPSKKSAAAAAAKKEGE